MRIRSEPHPDNMNLAAAHDRLIAIVGQGNARRQSLEDFLKDETYLRGKADLVLRPQHADVLSELIREMATLRTELPREKMALSFTLRGGGSGLSGACVPEGGIVLDLAALDQVTNIDEKNQTLTAGCGIILSDINAALSETNLQYAVDPSSLNICTLGGSVATNAAGPSSLKHGTTRQNLAALTYIDAGGTRIHAGSIPNKTSMGFSLTDLLCGSEGRLGVVTEVTVRLKPRAEVTMLALAAFASEEKAMEFVIRAKSLGPRSIEIIDSYAASRVDFPLTVAEDSALLMIEFDGSEENCLRDLERLMDLDTSLEWISARDEKSRRALWLKRQNITHELKKLFAYKLGEDIAVPLTALAHTARHARKISAAAGVKTAIWGHAGDGNLHVYFLLEREADLYRLEPLMLDLGREAYRVGGAISGEHGLGRLKKKIARAVMPPDYFKAQENIKTAFDPERVFNPALDL